jgi:hypothetical protein
MRSLFIKAFCFVMIGLSLGIKAPAQEDCNFTLSCEIHKVIPPLSISTYSALHANQIEDIYPYFKSDWIRTYNTVTLKTLSNGKMKTAIGYDNLFTPDQKKLLQHVDGGQTVHLSINYLPNNDLPLSELKEIAISFKINPARDAFFPGGDVKLQDYLNKNILQHVSKTNFKAHQLSAIQFTIDQEGSLTDSYIVESTGNPILDEMLLDALCKMPAWLPAEYHSGRKTSQSFILTVGDMNSCTLNLLNIKPKHLGN